MSLQVRVSTNLASPPEKVWELVLTTRLLRHINYPLAVFRPVDPAFFPESWAEGKFIVHMSLLGFVPFGKQSLVLSRQADPEPGAYVIRDNGYGDFVRRWDHRIEIRPAKDGTTNYSDTIEIEAGVLTPAVWLYAQALYRYRQARWRGLVANGFRTMRE